MNTQPQIKIVTFDETHFWIDDVVDKCGKIEGVYLVDTNYRVRVCSITPMYELNYLYSVGEKANLAEVLDGIGEDDDRAERVVYIEASRELNVVYTQPQEHNEVGNYSDLCAYRQWIDDGLIEEYMCNHVY